MGVPFVGVRRAGRRPVAADFAAAAGVDSHAAPLKRAVVPETDKAVKAGVEVTMPGRAWR